MATKKVAALKKAAPVKKAVKARTAKKVAAPAPVKKEAPKGCIKTECVVLTVQAEAGSKVFLAGSFNDWNPAEIEMKDKAKNGVFSATVKLAPGIYEYKFVINGVWTLDPDPDRDWTQNGLGTLNSVLRVG